MERHIFISDREKGIVISVPTVFDRSMHLHCCHHIADNLYQKYGNKVRPPFWRARRADTKEPSHEITEDLKVQSTPAFHYLCSIQKRAWPRAYTAYPRYGHDTSNIVEPLNASWSDIHCLTIYSEAMKTVYSRSTTKQRMETISNIPIAKFQARMKTSGRYQDFLSSNGIGQVEDHESSRK
jgi:transposase-like protein